MQIIYLNLNLQRTYVSTSYAKARVLNPFLKSTLENRLLCILISGEANLMTSLHQEKIKAYGSHKLQLPIIDLERRLSFSRRFVNIPEVRETIIITADLYITLIF